MKKPLPYRILREVGMKSWANSFAVSQWNEYSMLSWKGASGHAGSTLNFYTFKVNEQGVAKKDELVASIEASSDHSVTEKGYEVPASWTKLAALTEKVIVEVAALGLRNDVDQEIG